MASADVAKAVGRAAVASPRNGVAEVAGPEEFQLDELVRQNLRERDDPREVVADPQARYFGALLTENTLVPGDGAVFGELRLGEWQGQVASLIGKPPRQEPATATSL